METLGQVVVYSILLFGFVLLGGWAVVGLYNGCVVPLAPAILPIVGYWQGIGIWVFLALLFPKFNAKRND